MAQLNYESKLDLPNPSARAARVLLIVMVSLFAWCLAAVTYAVAASQGTAAKQGWRQAFVVGGMIGGAAALIVGIIYLSVRSDARRIELFRRQFLDGHFLVRWRYSPETWRAFRATVAGDEARRWRTFMTWMIVIAAAGLAMAVILPLRRPGSATPEGVRAVVGLGIVICAVFSTIAGVSVRLRAERVALLATPQDSLVSTIGAYTSGKWLLWGTFQHKLGKAEVVGGRSGGPPMIELVIQSGEHVHVEHVPVPAGQEAIAERVVEAIRKSPNAQGGGDVAGITAILRGVTEIVRP